MVKIDPTEWYYLALIMPTFSWPIRREKNPPLVHLAFLTGYDCFRGSDQGVPMAGMLGQADWQLSGERSQKRSFRTVGVTAASRPIVVCFGSENRLRIFQ